MVVVGEPERGWLALGLDLLLRAEGGRRTALDLTSSRSYRPNWGLPWMTGSDQTGAWVLCGEPTTLPPGARGRVVIAPQMSDALDQWRRVAPGDDLRAFEGAKVVGTGRVRWLRRVESAAPTGRTLELLRRWVGAGLAEAPCEAEPTD